MEVLSKVPGKLPSGSLYRYFKENVGSECSIQHPGSQTAALCSSTDSLVNWRAGQRKVWDGLAREIIAKAGDPNVPLDLVFLVHGFNNTHGNSSQSYVKARNALSRHANPGRTLRFVEIYWDGFRSPIGLGAWGKAQASGPLVGFHLRSLLNSLSDEIAARKSQDVDLKILSHSSGAFVLGATFGDPSAALPEMQAIDNDDYRTFVINAASRNGAYPGQADRGGYQNQSHHYDGSPKLSSSTGIHPAHSDGRAVMDLSGGRTHRHQARKRCGAGAHADCRRSGY